MKLKKNIATSETGFIFNPATGDSFTANALATEILQLLKQDRSPADIKTLLLNRYDVEPNQLEKDWDDLVAQLRDHQLLD
ncbi:PqqD family protein [Hymenobacter sp. 15J16-1T3B]|uniref:PqqD family protein n=1 Tax=Hymenobacter jeollabukensis TaxID=2025313 RepID=A0A5R8WWN7_9BACT|nr:MULTISPECIES: PqqD family protein [Hymenobacter]MCC3160709.1 PqqD family protein [Hymenobacter sp. 15J16-1T3B]TLM96947.1 PqqD family protein [Hymenobacter jeollabukensis]